MHFNNLKAFWLCLAVQVAATSYALAIAPQIQTNVYKGVPDNWVSSIDTEPFVKIGHKYYFIDPNHEVNWFEAAHECSRRNAQLASIENAQELEAITQYLLAKEWNLWIWTSGNDLGKEGKFYWLGTGQPVSYVQWANYQPDNRGGIENCIHLLMQNAKYVMNDRDCTETSHYICEARTPRTVAFTIW